MAEFWKKIKGSWINSLLFSCFLLGIFFLLFYLSNLNLKKTPSRSAVQDEAGLSLDTETELKKRLGENDFSFLGYETWAKFNKLGSGQEKYDGDPDKDGLANYLEYIHLTDPRDSDTDHDKFNDYQEIINGYDPDSPGGSRPFTEISIEKIGVIVPMIWSTSEKEKSLEKDLEDGVIHFPKTASPGQVGNMVLSGHSSNYIWAKGNYNHIFKDLNNLTEGDVATVKTVQKNSRIIVYHYRVTEKKITAPDDAYIFENTQKPTLTLSTCWPLGTALRRLIIKAELISN